MAENKSFLGEIGASALQGLRNGVYDKIDKEVYYERIDGIKKAIAAMVEAKVKDDMIIRMLQKYWDLRLSEAIEFLEEQKMDKK